MNKISNTRHNKSLPMDEIKAMYLNGDSVLKISKHFGVSRDTIHKRLSEMGVYQRSGSEAAIIRMSKMSEIEKKMLTSNANKSTTNKKSDPKIHRKRAITIQDNPYEHYIGMGEVEFKDMLDCRKIKYTWQKAIDIYSIDFLVGSVAVELRKAKSDRGFIGRKKGRTKFLKENGITTIYVSFMDIDSLKECFPEILEHILSLNDRPLEIGRYATFSCLWIDTEVLRDSKGRYYSKGIPKSLKTSFKLMDY